MLLGMREEESTMRRIEKVTQAAKAAIKTASQEQHAKRRLVKLSRRTLAKALLAVARVYQLQIG